MRVGPKMQMVRAFVAANPGCSVRAAAHFVNPSPVPEKCEGYGYDTVDRAVQAGLVRRAPHPTHKGWRLLFLAD